MIEKISAKTKVAVLFGGPSPEHDVSVVTGLQALAAVDSARFEAFPVYITPQGVWLTGAPLRQRANFLPKRPHKDIREVQPDIGARGRGGFLRPVANSLFGKKPPIPFDIALLAFHGAVGEDGPVQGLLEVMGVPYAGMRLLASAVTMDKAATKRLLASTGVPLLPHAELKRPGSGLLLPPSVVRQKLEAAGVNFPLILKPAHLGSSIGVVPVKNMDELLAVLPMTFRLDHLVLAEPLVPNLVEYNIAVRNGGEGVETSAIEQPKRADEILDFKQKYLSGSGAPGPKLGGAKQPGTTSEGMLSLTRTLNPDMPPGLEEKIRAAAAKAFVALSGTGAPRIDFLVNGASGEFWLNEINPIPGSFGYFLWEARKEGALGFTNLLTALLDEAAAHLPHHLADDPVPEDARLFRR